MATQVTTCPASLASHDQFWPVLQRLRQVWGADFLAALQICYCARQFQDSVIGSRRQIHLIHSCTHQALTLVLQPAKLPYLPDAHIRVADDIGFAIRKPLVLNIPRGLDTPANGFTGFP